MDCCGVLESNEIWSLGCITNNLCSIKIVDQKIFEPTTISEGTSPLAMSNQLCYLVSLTFAVNRVVLDYYHSLRWTTRGQSHHKPE